MMRQDESNFRVPPPPSGMQRRLIAREFPKEEGQRHMPPTAGRKCASAEDYYPGGPDDTATMSKYKRQKRFTSAFYGELTGTPTMPLISFEVSNTGVEFIPKTSKRRSGQKENRKIAQVRNDGTPRGESIVSSKSGGGLLIFPHQDEVSLFKQMDTLPTHGYTLKNAGGALETLKKRGIIEITNVRTHTFNGHHHVQKEVKLLQPTARFHRLTASDQDSSRMADDRCSLAILERLFKNDTIKEASFELHPNAEAIIRPTKDVSNQSKKVQKLLGMCSGSFNEMLDGLLEKAT